MSEPMISAIDCLDAAEDVPSCVNNGPVTPEELDGLRLLMGAADPLPWRACTANGGCQCGNVWSLPLDTLLMTALFEGQDRPNESRAANAAYAAAVCSAFPRLLATIEAQDAEIERLKKQLEWLRGQGRGCGQ